MIPRQPIALLPPDEVAKICAGEVVERPLSVVKELIENALDAGATEITVELEDGGRRMIRVSDNGGGIPRAELELALRPHHTSKLRVLDDLYRLGTLGFRGEALGAIAAVSKLALSSKFVGAQPAAPETQPGSSTAGGAGSAPTAEPGARVEMHGGSIVASGISNIQRGTEVEVRELFYNTPARLKFLRSAQSETSQVSGLLTTYALAYPEVRWKLISGGRTLLASSGDGGMLSVISALLGAELADGLAPVHFEYPPCAVTGFISAPQRHWHNRTRQWYLVNRRPVTNKLLYKAVDDAMREFVSPGRFPAGVFCLDMPPEEIDVNVHPAKSEIAFAQPQAVYSLLLTAVRRALGDAAADRQRHLTQGMSSAISPAPVSPPVEVDHPRFDFAAASAATAEAAAAEMLDPALDPDAPVGMHAVPVYEFSDRIVPPIAATILSPNITGHRPELPISPTPDAGLNIADVSQIMQVADTYLVLVTPGEVYLIDQHSAHERVLFEALWERLAMQGAASAARQKLLFETRVALTPAESALAEEMLPSLEQLGFRAQLDGSTLLVSEVPALLASRLSPELLQATLADLATGVGEHSGDVLQYGAEAGLPVHDMATALGGALKNLTATLACKAAVKAGQYLPDSERRKLAELICSRWSSLTCPHGRPTVVRLGEGELEKLFLRT